jgi:hypothetical protein
MLVEEGMALGVVFIFHYNRTARERDFTTEANVIGFIGGYGLARGFLLWVLHIQVNKMFVLYIHA